MQVALPPNRLRELIDRDGLRLSSVAAHCDVDQSTVYRWREGQTAIPDEQKFRLARLFGVSIAFLMGWDGPEGSHGPESAGETERQAA